MTDVLTGWCLFHNLNMLIQLSQGGFGHSMSADFQQSPVPLIVLLGVSSQQQELNLRKLNKLILFPIKKHTLKCMSIFCRFRKMPYLRKRKATNLPHGNIHQHRKRRIPELDITVKYYNKLRLLGTIHTEHNQEKAKGRIKAMAIWYDSYESSAILVIFVLIRLLLSNNF